MNKSASRELAFQLLYSTQIQKEMEEEQFELFCQNNEIEDEKVKAYIKDILFGVKSKEREIEKLISDNLKKHIMWWPDFQWKAPAKSKRRY